MTTLPNRIREHRQAKGWAQDRLAAEVGCSKNQISDLERGNRGLTVQWMKVISSALGLRAGDLLCSSDNPFHPQDDDERLLLRRFRNASDADRAQFMKVLDLVLQRDSADADSKASESA